MPEMIRKMKAGGLFAGVRALALLAGVAGCLLAWTGCNPHIPKPPPPPAYPSVVVTQDGMAYYVKGLRLPGTRQELRLKAGDSLTWVPLEQVAVMRFTGPLQDTYRPATIILTGGERLQGEVFVDFLIEGTTDTGYWNMPMRKVKSLEMGFN